MTPTPDNGQVPQPTGRPPWTNVDPGAVIDHLTARISALVTELAMRDAYIASLHAALETAAAAGLAASLEPQPTPT